MLCGLGGSCSGSVFCCRAALFLVVAVCPHDSGVVSKRTLAGGRPLSAQKRKKALAIRKYFLWSGLLNGR